MPRSMGYVTASVLNAVLRGQLYGADIMAETGLSGVTVYKILRRLERRGHIEGRWEKPLVAERERRPRRRYYALTQSGEVALEAAVAHFRVLMPAESDRSLASEGR